MSLSVCNMINIRGVRKGHFQIVFYGNNCNMMLLVELAQECVNTLLAFTVDTCRRFVENDEVRMTDEGAGYGNPLRLTAGQLADETVLKVCHAG